MKRSQLSAGLVPATGRQDVGPIVDRLPPRCLATSSTRPVFLTRSSSGTDCNGRETSSPEPGWRGRVRFVML